MRYFPIFVDLQDRPVTVVGGSEEALRKIRLLLKTGAMINVIAPALQKNWQPSRASTGSPRPIMRDCWKAPHWSIRRMRR